jgi:hypothetical protein
MEALYGEADFLLRQHETDLRKLGLAGHELGWHPHCYLFAGGQWRQNTDVPSVVKELVRYGDLARSYGFQSVRMGWGFHANETMRVLAKLGFLVDSSAIPRPKYPWDETEKDWRGTPDEPYFPSESDYRVPGRPALPILEIPISVTPIKAPYDKEDVLRYVNPAYHSSLLWKSLGSSLAQHSHLVTVTHPYELSPRGSKQDLLAFSVEIFEQNILFIKQRAEAKGLSTSFKTISELASAYKRECNG